jgi:hypothetical protein
MGNSKTISLREIVYKNRIKWLIAFFVGSSALFIFAAWMSGGVIQDKFYDIVYHISAIAVVLVLTELVLADFSKFAEINAESELLSEIKSISSTISGLAPSVFLDTAAQVFAYTQPWVKNAKTSIDVTASARSPRAPPDWLDDLTTNLRENLRDGRSIIYNIKFFVNFQKIDTSFVEIIESRVKKHSEAGVQSLIRLQFIDSNEVIGWDMMIVDGTKVALRFCGDSNNLSNNFSVVFDGPDKIGRSFASWYANLPAGISLDAMRRQKRYQLCRNI